MEIGQPPPQSNHTTLRLHTGEEIFLSPPLADRVYDELWLLAKSMKGAIAAASKLKHVNAWTHLHGEDVLTPEETSAFREAMRRAEPSD